MTIRELIDALKTSAKESGRGLDTTVVLGAGFDENDRLETLSLQTEPPDGENDLIFEEKFEGDGEAEVLEYVESTLQNKVHGKVDEAFA